MLQGLVPFVGNRSFFMSYFANIKKNIWSLSVFIVTLHTDTKINSRDEIPVYDSNPTFFGLHFFNVML